MKVFTCTDHDIHWPTGGASVVVARNEIEARVLLELALAKKGLHTEDFTLDELDLSEPHAIVLYDGEY